MVLHELEDYPWFPALLRRYQMEFIGIMVSRLRLYDKVVEMIRGDLAKSSLINIQDLCSGSGLPAIFVHNSLEKSVTTTLTDKYPQDVDSSTDLHYYPDAIDVTAMEISSDKYYTMYNAFHHFDSNDQKALIQKVLDKNGHLLIVEIVQPSFLTAISVTLASTIGLWVLCPLIKPFEWKRLFFTYIIPINVLTVLIDGYISILKSKSKKSYLHWVNTHFGQSALIKVTEHFSFPSYIITIKVGGS